MASKRHVFIPRTTLGTSALAGLSLVLAACGHHGHTGHSHAPAQQSKGALHAAPFAQACSSLVGTQIEGNRIGASAGLKSGNAQITSTTYTPASGLSVAAQGPTPAATITPAMPNHCRVLGSIDPVDPNAPKIQFQINLPEQWNGRSVQYGGGGFNGVLITGLSLVPAAPYDKPAPLGQGYVTYGTDSGHQNQPNVPVQAFALNDEALENFAHASYKKVRDVAVAMMTTAYGRAPTYLYFAGSSEGGREGVMMAQRYPKDFNGIFSRVPVLHWTGLQHVGLRDGLALMNGGWMNAAQTQLVHNAVLAACDELDGAKDGIVSNPLACKAKFDVTRLACQAAPNDGCLTAAQINAVKTLASDLVFSPQVKAALPNGLTHYPGRGPSGEALTSFGPTGGWAAWWTGRSAPTLPPRPDNGIAWLYGGGAIQYFYANNANADLLTYKAENHLPRLQRVAALMDATNPDLSAFHQVGGKLIVLEQMADYAQSPYAGIQYFESVQKLLGKDRTAQFARLYASPNIDHVGTGGPAMVDILGALSQWVEKGAAPKGLQLAEQDAKAPFSVSRTRPLCEWPQYPRFRGGDVNQAANFDCVN